MPTRAGLVCLQHSHALYPDDTPLPLLRSTSNHTSLLSERCPAPSSARSVSSVSQAPSALFTSQSLQHSFCYPWPANVFLAPRSQLPCWLRPLSLSPYSFRHPQLIALLSCREPAFTLITPRVPVPSFAVTPRRCRRSSACACARLPIAVMDVVSRRRTDSAATLLRLLYSASPSVQPSVSLGCRVSSRCSTT
jgi:hypothetical protein